jgi:hypothetical protein
MREKIEKLESTVAKVKSRIEGLEKLKEESLVMISDENDDEDEEEEDDEEEGEDD